MKSFLLFIAVFLIAGFSVLSAQDQNSREQYPSFSWDTLPVFHHAGKTSGLYTEREIAFLAEHFALVVFEKMHAQQDPRFKNQLEKAVFQNAKRIKALNPNVKILAYLNAFLDNCPYSWQEELQAHPEWLLRNEQGEPIYKVRGSSKIPQFDITHPKWQQWWLNAVQKTTGHPDIDGLFIDALIQVVRHPQKKRNTWGWSKYLAMRAECDTVLSKTRSIMNPRKIIINNGLFATVPGLDDGGIGWLEYASGAMAEHFGAFGSRKRDGKLDPELMAREIELIQNAAARGKIVLVKGWPGDFSWLNPKYKSFTRNEKQNLAKKRLDFSLAAFLIAAEQYSYFGYSWGWQHDHGWMQWYPEYDKPLGPPLQPAQQDGWTYTREFRHASVRLDLEREEGQILWK
jgi:hypothetical protein